MLILFVLITVVAVGLASISLAERRHLPYYGAWSDEAERRLLRDREVGGVWR